MSGHPLVDVGEIDVICNTIKPAVRNQNCKRCGAWLSKIRFFGVSLRGLFARYGAKSQHRAGAFDGVFLTIDLDFWFL